MLNNKIGKELEMINAMNAIQEVKDIEKNIKKFDEELKAMTAVEFAELMKNWMCIHANDEDLMVGQIDHMFEEPVHIFYNNNCKILKTEYFEKKKEAEHQYKLLINVVKDVLVRILNNPNSKISLKERQKLIGNLYTDEESIIKKSFGASAYNCVMIKMMTQPELWHLSK